VDRGLADRAWFPGVLRQSTIVVSTAALAYETGEGMIKNMTQLGIGNPFTLDSFKVVGAMAVTRETVRMAVPGTSKLFNTELAKAVIRTARRCRGGNKNFAGPL